MKTKILLTTIVSAFIILPSALGQGALTPPGAPAPTMKTLAQIEPRTAITNAASAVMITNSGSYYLTGNLTVSSGDAITIATNGVTLDLNGFTISSTLASAAGNGILINTGLRNLTILNGFIQGGVTNNGSGVYGGSGFANGIDYLVNSPVNVLVSKVSVSGCKFNGIHLGAGDATVVEACTTRTIGNDGIWASTVKGCGAADCGIFAIIGDQVSDCRGAVAGNSGTGIFAYRAAQNCYGYSSGSGPGLNTVTAQNCYGYSSGGFGISATTAQNCYGSSNSGTGLNVSDVAIGCHGDSNSGTGLNAFIANSCHGASGSGTPLTTTHNVNSF